MKGFIPKDMHPFVVLLLLIAFMIGGAFIASFFYSVLGEYLYGISIFELAEALANPTDAPDAAAALMFYQGITSFFMFIVAPLFLLRTMNFDLGPYLSWKERPALALVLLSGLVVVLIMPLNSLIINWNAGIHFPEFMQGFEDWARAEEDQAGQMTKLLANFGTLPQLLVGLLVIAVIPAIGEELVFRGVLQRQLHRWAGNMHVAVWLAALIFAAIHVQFFGFVPRVVLGALFGYLYFWSGRIVVPMVAHFVNNGFTVFLLYLQQTGQMTNFDVESTEPMPWYSIVLSLVLSAAVLYFLYQRFLAVPVRPEGMAAVEVPQEKEDEV
ncbi:CPBP family intramembrane metalloprotease [Pontibacter sp. 172403-2]|uniref:CPBP family intramembrane glutamic endopeptidase n=1 Tax=Pontibacter rufus TaxID=2791028 RepID=UPI0018AF8044|nr:CPBP family intramembrane glutamic endopeptidase [Pontibacter sp. 172403-2]MBF9253202.1 CPBP family intramembrane metalloprotease [Pontibacter sp. 172403-2]